MDFLDEIVNTAAEATSALPAVPEVPAESEPKEEPMTLLLEILKSVSRIEGMMLTNGAGMIPTKDLAIFGGAGSGGGSSDLSALLAENPLQ